MTDIGPDAARMLWARKAVHPDGTTRNEFRWPVGVGGWVEQDGPADGEACGVGLHLGLTVAGLSSVHRLTESILLAVGWLPEDELGRDGDKVRVRRCYVAPGWHTSLPLVLRDGWGIGANLARANLTGAYLTGANLDRANLTGANLIGANLTGANLARAYLDRANLARANLTGAYLTGANLDRANLAEANLARANLARANLAEANLARAYLARANLARAYLARANLAEANLARANLARANLAEANLAGARVGWSSDTPRPAWLPSGWTVVDGLIRREDR